MRISRSVLTVAVCAALLIPASTAMAATTRIDGVTAASATDVYLAGGYTTAANERFGFISRSRDGGYTWTASRQPSIWLTRLQASGPTLWATGMYKPYAYSSTDFGATLTRSAGAAASGAWLSEVFPLSATRLVAVGWRTGVASGNPALISLSTNGGATWSKRFEGPLYKPTGEGDPPPTRASLADVEMAPGGTVWALGNEWTPGGSSLVYKRRLIYKSTDSGSTWTTQTPLAHVPQRIMTCLTAPSADVVYAFGENRQFLKTTNGGTAWSALDLDAITGVREINVRAADSLDTNRIVVVGDHKTTSAGALTGIIGRSTDGGDTWTYTRRTDVPSLRAVTMLTDTHWIAVGGNEVVLHTTDAGVTWSGMAAPVAPTIRVDTPLPGFALTASPVVASGTASDTGTGVSAVDVRVRRTDGRFFDGVSWVTKETWLPAATTDEWRTWAFSWTPDAATRAARMSVTVSFVAIDGSGNRSSMRSLASAGKTSAYLSAPSGLPSTMVRGRTYRFSGYLKPQHSIGSTVVRVYAERYERQRTGQYKWVPRRVVYAKAAAYQKYTGTISLPYAGTWRLRAYHPSDSLHIASYSSYRTLKVK